MAATSKKKARKQTKKKSAKKTTTKKKVVKKKPSSARKVAKVAKKTKKKATKKTVAAKRTKSIGSRKRSNGKQMIFGITPYKVRRGEEYMNSDQLDHFRNILSAWRRELVDEVNRTIHVMQDETVNHPDPNDRATQESDMSLELRSRDRERKLIKKIDGTVALIDSGDYGYCEKCGVEVGIARLEARPTASLCIDCKTLDEIREKQMI